MHSRLPKMPVVATSLLVAVTLIGGESVGGDAPVAAIERWSNVKAGEEVTLHFRVPDAAAGQVVSWSIAVDTAVIVRSRSEVRANADQQPVLAVKFRIPDGEPTTAVPVTVRIAQNGGEVPAKRLWIYPDDPFQQPIPHLPAEPLVLFDPQGATAARFEETRLQIRREKNISALAEMREGVLVIGEGVSFRAYRGLPEVIRTAAERGVRVLCLAPSAGTLLLSGTTSREDRDGMTRDLIVHLDLRRADLLSRFEKRLDAFDWRGAAPVGPTSLQPVSRSGQISAEITAAVGGWPWLEAEYTGGGRIVVCGLRCIEHWESGPAPRHALWHVLSHAVRPAVASDAESAAAEELVQGP